MTNELRTVPASDVKPGDRIRHPSGRELTVTRIEPGFFGRPEMLAFIQDDESGWFKAPVPNTAEVEILA
jgi:hypothetical protein